MYVTRKGTWETNSSSTHALCIQNKEIEKINYIYFGLQDFADYDGVWTDLQERANYIHSCMACMNRTEYINVQQKIIKELKDRGIRVEWCKINWSKIGNCVDELEMKDCLIEEVNNLLKTDIDLILKFIFNNDSTIIAGYDDYYDKYKEDYQKQHPEGEDYKYVYYKY